MDEVITGDGLRLAVFEEGVVNGPTVVLVHGFPDTSRVWDPLVGELGDRFRVVRCDVRGVGGSQMPGNVDGFRIERVADDLRRVAEATKEPVHLVGMTGERCRGGGR